MSATTLLGECLRAVRSLPHSAGTVSDVLGADFFGSPFRALGIDAPWLEGLRVAPLEGVPDADTPFELLDWEAIARARKAGTCEVAHHLLIFLELLRCIASPMTGIEGTRLLWGVCRPGALPSEYFRADPEQPCDYIAATYAFRRGFFLLYAHLLLRSLSRRDEAFVNAVFDVDNADERMRRLRTVLQRPSDMDEKSWKVLSTSAALFVGSQTFRQCFLGKNRREALPPFRQRGAGSSTRLYREIYEEEFSVASEVSLPAPLAFILHIILDDRSDNPTLGLLPKSLQRDAHILCDERRIERVARMLMAEERGSWWRVGFTRREMAHGSTKPSSHYCNLASFCAVLEFLLGQELPGIGLTPVAVAEGGMGKDEVGEEGPALLRQIELLVAEVASDGDGKDSAQVRRSGTRFATGRPEGDFEFSSDGVATLSFGRTSGVSRPLGCKVQRSAEGPGPVGAILVPVARHLVGGKLGVEFHVVRVGGGGGAEGPERVTRVGAEVSDYFVLGEGVVFCVEVEEPELVGSGFRVCASMRITGGTGESRGERLCCVIACVVDVMD